MPGPSIIWSQGLRDCPEEILELIAAKLGSRDT
jgi:hypothetical protein